MAPALLLLEAFVTVARASPATPQQFIGGWCRPSNGVEPKAYFEYEYGVGWKPSAEECLSACQEELEDSLACAEFSDGNACFCMAKSIFGGAVTDFCWSRASPGTLSYVVGVDKPRDCGEGHDCCDCGPAETQFGGDNCASWDLNLEWRKCRDGGMPIPTGKECYYDHGEIIMCCEPCRDGEPPTRDIQVCYQDHDEHWEHSEHCEIGEDDWEVLWVKVLIGSIVGTIIGIALVVGASLPVCCGIGKDSKLTCFAIAIGLLAGICFFIPLIAGVVATDAAIDKHCGKCHCDEEELAEAYDIINGLSPFIAYVSGLGFVVVALAIAAEVLACCMCFRCCGPLKNPRPQQHQQQQQLVPGQVVGAPVVSV